MSQDWKKDYHQIPPKYAMLGVQELFVFDPEWRHRPTGVGVAFRVYRRDANGDLHCVHAGERGHWSEELEIFVVAVGRSDRVRLRLAYDIDGRVLVPTSADAQDAALGEIARHKDEIEGLRALLSERDPSGD